MTEGYIKVGNWKISSTVHWIDDQDRKNNFIIFGVEDLGGKGKT
jgi:hypothetical protein